MYAGVPSTLPACDSSRFEPLRTVATRLSSGAGWAGGSSAPRSLSTLARPQSITWTSPKLPTMTFDGFRSRWITPRAWAYATVWQMASKIERKRGRSRCASAYRVGEGSVPRSVFEGGDSVPESIFDVGGGSVPRSVFDGVGSVPESIFDVGGGSVPPIGISIGSPGGAGSYSGA